MMTADRRMPWEAEHQTQPQTQSQADGVSEGLTLRFVPLSIRTHRLLCMACGVFAAVQIAGRRKDASPIYAVASLCEVCRWNYIHATKKP